MARLNQIPVFFSGFEVRNIRLGSSSGWCAQTENFTFVEMDLGQPYRITTLRLKGVLTNGIAGRVTQLRLFTKLNKAANYAPLESEVTDNSASYGTLSTIPLPRSVRARHLAIGVLGYTGYPCLKMELYGCPAESDEKAVVGWNSTVPGCVDVEPPKFTNCPDRPVVVHKLEDGQLSPVQYEVPVAVDNSGKIARMEMRPADFVSGGVVWEDMEVEYTAYDSDGNNASCSVSVRTLETKF